MFKLKKLNAFFITLIFSGSIFSSSVGAVVVGGSVSGAATEPHLISSVLVADKQQILNDSVDAVAKKAANLEIASQQSTPHGLDVAQHSSLLPSASVYDNLVGYTGLENSGIANRAEYHGWMISELTAVDMKDDDVVTVPEPSPILLFLGPLLLLLWRLDLLPKALRRLH